MTTWGDAHDFRHFLPRVIELLLYDNEGGLIDLETVLRKLKYARWKTWPEEECGLIQEFLVHQLDIVLHHPLRYFGISDFETFLPYFSITEILDRWELKSNPAALRKLACMIYHSGNELFNPFKTNKIIGEAGKEAIIQHLKKIEIEPLLEQAFFEHETTDADYADQLSIALQILEPELKQSASQNNP